MGGSVSTNVPKIAEKATKEKMEEEIIPFVLPIYYTAAPITPIELESAVAVWKMIINNRSEHFNKLKKDNNPEVAEMQLCMEYFFHVFYVRLFDIHPSCRKLFTRSIHKQGSFFLRFFSLCISEFQEPEKFAKTLENLANIHNKLGVKAVEYGIAGEAIFYTLRKCTGDAYTDAAHAGWTKIYSAMLRGIVPFVVRFELTEKDKSKVIAEKRTVHNATAPAETLFTKHVSTTMPPPVSMAAESDI